MSNSNTTIDRPHKILWLILPFIIIASFIFKNNTIDLHFHDTYFVISAMHLGIFYSIIIAVSGVIYWLLRQKNLNNWLTLFQVISIIIISLMMFVTVFLSSLHSHDEDLVNYSSSMFIHKTLLGLTVVNLLLLLINTISALIGKK